MCIFAKDFHREGNLKLSFKALVNLELWEHGVQRNLFYILRRKGRKEGRKESKNE